LRDFAASCLAEFVRWSLKYSESLDPNSSSSLHISSMLRRLFALAHHSNSYKRLGACLTFNQVFDFFVVFISFVWPLDCRSTDPSVKIRTLFPCSFMKSFRIFSIAYE
jgi:hypothetical protein